MKSSHELPVQHSRRQTNVHSPPHWQSQYYVPVDVVHWALWPLQTALGLGHSLTTVELQLGAIPGCLPLLTRMQRNPVDMQVGKHVQGSWKALHCFLGRYIPISEHGGLHPVQCKYQYAAQR